MSIRQLDGLAAVADRYALFIIDQWGVLHNGEALLDGAIETMHALRERGKKIVILSNSSKRLGISTRRMAEMGIHAGLLRSLRHLRRRSLAGAERAGRTLLCRTWPALHDFYLG